jgi:hypothetical protein
MKQWQDNVEFFVVRLLERKVYLFGISILLILLKP